ncbi:MULTISPECIES: DUF6641 family protein [Rhizobium/Agrobacterium group]|nr:DUF6641 family protein [Rhizobium rhizogenes]
MNWISTESLFNHQVNARPFGRRLYLGNTFNRFAKDHSMSHLKALKLTSAVPFRASVDPVQRSREKMIAALSEQKQMAEAKIAGQAFTPTHIVRKKNAEGVRVEVEAPKRVRQGWFIDGNGKVFFAIRYAGKAIEFAKDKNAIEAGELSALPKIIDTLIEAVRAGELDAQLTAAAVERGKMLRRAG